jgi:HEAT repeat protein
MRTLLVSVFLALAQVAYGSESRQVAATQGAAYGEARATTAIDPKLTEEERQRLVQLMSDLKSSDPRTLDDAFQQLAAMGPKAEGAVDALAQMLDDGRVITYSNLRYRTLRHTFKVNISAANVLRNIGKAAVPSLITALTNEDPEVRRSAAGGLVSIGEPIPSKHWLQALKDSDKYVKFMAAGQLGKAKDASATDALVALLKDDDMEVRIEAAKALGEIGDEKAVDPLVDVLSEAPRNRYSPSYALAKIGRPAIKALIERFDTFGDAVKGPAAVAIQQCDALALKDLLLPYLENKHPEIREAALYALIRHKLPEAVPACLKLVGDKDRGARWTAARGLGELADKESADAARSVLLKMARNDIEPGVRVEAMSSLARIPGKPPSDMWKTVRDLMGHESPRVREAAAAWAQTAWNSELAPDLMKLLKDPSPRVRAEAAVSLSVHRIPEALPGLIALLDDPDADCARDTAFSLTRYKTAEALNALIDKVKDTNAVTANRKAAVTALCYTKAPVIVEALIVALEDRIDASSSRVQNTLKQLTGQGFGNDAAKWRAWYDGQKSGAVK